MTVSWDDGKIVERIAFLRSYTVFCFFVSLSLAIVCVNRSSVIAMCFSSIKIDITNIFDVRNRTPSKFYVNIQYGVRNGLDDAHSNIVNIVNQNSYT